MSGGGGSSGQQSTSTKVELPAWLEDASHNAVNYSQSIAERPYQTYTGQRLAGFNGDQTAAMQQVRDQNGQTGAALTGLAGQASGVMGTQAPTVGAGSVGGLDLSRYIDPNLATVEQGALTQMDRQRQLAQQGNEDRAIGAGAFGGSRMALQQGVTDADYATQAGQMSAQLRSNAFNTALQTATGDLNRDLTAQQSNQSSYLQNLGLGLQGLSLGGQLTNQAHQANMSDIDALGAVGQQQQQQTQAGLDLGAAEWERMWNYPKDQLATRMSALSGLPYGSSQSSTGPATTQGANPAMGALGGAASGAAAGSMIMPGWGTAAGAVVGGAMGYFGSRR